MFKKLLKFILKLVLKKFFAKEIFSSHYFVNGFLGYRWALRALIYRNILRLGPVYPVPVAPGVHINGFNNLNFDYDDLNNFQSPGCYFQCFDGNIRIGKGSYIAPNVGIITSNHDTQDLKKHVRAKDVVIGNKCWLGMNVVLLPGVTLGDNCIVGAGAVVHKSFPSGSVIGGVPARIIRTIKRNGI